MIIYTYANELQRLSTSKTCDYDNFEKNDNFFMECAAEHAFINSYGAIPP